MPAPSKFAVGPGARKSLAIKTTPAIFQRTTSTK